MGNGNNVMSSSSKTTQFNNKIKTVYSNQYCGKKTDPLYNENVFLIFYSFNTINNSQHSVIQKKQK